MWASLVLPSVTRWESEVAYVFFFFLLYMEKLLSTLTSAFDERPYFFFLCQSSEKNQDRLPAKTKQSRGEPSQPRPPPGNETRRDETSAAGREGGGGRARSRRSNLQSAARMAPATTAPHREDPPATTSSEDSLFTDRERGFMRLALAEAEEAYEVGEIPVGCVLVRRGEVIGKGQNRTNETRNGTRHCEMEAIDGVLVGFSQNSEERQSREAMARFWDEVDLYVTCSRASCARARAHGRSDGILRVLERQVRGCSSVHTVSADGCGKCGGGDGSPALGFDCRKGLFAGEAITLLKTFTSRDTRRQSRTEAPVAGPQAGAGGRDGEGGEDRGDGLVE